MGVDGRAGKSERAAHVLPSKAISRSINWPYVGPSRTARTESRNARASVSRLASSKACLTGAAAFVPSLDVPAPIFP